jgi:flagellar protein FlaF
MYQFRYEETIEDDFDRSRAEERRAFDHALLLLQQAEDDGPNSRSAAEAMFFLQRLWHILLDDLAGAENDLPDQLKASLISVGIWTLKEITAVRLGNVTSFAGLIDINTIIRNGLV